jgi:hypothetical protein
MNVLNGLSNPTNIDDTEALGEKQASIAERVFSK